MQPNPAAVFLDQLENGLGGHAGADDAVGHYSIQSLYPKFKRSGS